MKRVLVPLAALAPLMLMVPLRLSAAPAGRGGPPRVPPPPAAALPAYLDGLEALAAGKYGEAADSFSKAIGADEEHPAAYLARGVARTLNQQFAEAVADLERAGRLAGPGANWEYRGWLAIAQKLAGDVNSSFVPGIAPGPDREYALALSDMESTYFASVRSGGYWDRRANRRVETAAPYTGEFPRVAQLFVERHRTVTGEASRLMLARVQARLKAEDFRGALDALRPLLAASPDDAHLLTAQAQALLAMGDAATARRLFTRVLAGRPKDVAVLAGRAAAAAREGDALRVSRDVQLLRRLDPAAAAEAEPKLSQAVLAAHATGDPRSLWATLVADARRDTSAAQLAKTAQSLLAALAPLRQRNDERYQDRRFALEEALQAAPADPDRIAALGRFLFDETSILHEQVEPRSNPRWYRTQSEASRQADLQSIRDLVGRALARSPKHLGALTLQAHLHFQDNQFAECEAVVRQALAIKADDPQLLDLLAQLLYVSAARRAAAAADLRTVRVWTERRLDTYPPTDWIFSRSPTDAELARAEALDREARRLTALAQEHLGKAVAANAGTAIGAFLQATLARLQGDLERARDAMTQAVMLDAAYEKAWFQLAGINAQLQLGDAATLARARGLNITQTTAAPWLTAAWFKIPRTQFRTARENLTQAVTFDPGDPRIPAYLGIINSAAGQPAEALGHFRAAVALADARLRTHGWTVPPQASVPPLDPAELGLPVILRIRLGAMYLLQGKPEAAEGAFREALALTQAMGEDAGRSAIPSALLPNPDLPEGVVPLAETPASLRMRAQAGSEFAAWARAGRAPEDVAAAGKAYHRLVVAHALEHENLDALQGLANMGLAQLYLKSNQPELADAQLRKGAGVPTRFQQEFLELRDALERRNIRRAEPDAGEDARRQGRRPLQNDGGDFSPAEAAVRAQMRGAYQQQLNALDAQLRDPALSPARRQALQRTRDRLVEDLQQLER